jgi:hypothetical protein
MQKIKQITRGAVVALLSVAALGSMGSAAHATTGTVGSHRTGTVRCATPDSVSLAPLFPTIKAVNRTTGVDYQNVAFQPTIYKWNGSQWVEYQGGMLLYGRASDSASPSVWRDWATGQTVDENALTATLTGRGYYRVAIHFYWLDSSYRTTGSDYLWSSTYVTPIGAVVSYCTR